MTEQLYRWVKCSERLPDEDGLYLVLHSPPGSTGRHEMFFKTEDKKWYWQPNPYSVCGHGFITEWLEPYTPSPVSGSLEQDFKEINIYLDDLYKQMTSGEKDAGHLWIAFTDKFNAFEKKVLSQYSTLTAPADKEADQLPEGITIDSEKELLMLIIGAYQGHSWEGERAESSLQRIYQYALKREHQIKSTDEIEGSISKGEERIKQLEKAIWQISLGPDDQDNEWIPYVVQKCKDLLTKKQ